MNEVVEGRADALSRDVSGDVFPSFRLAVEVDAVKAQRSSLSVAGPI